MNFSSAKKYCRDNGYELSKMRSEDELNYLKNVNYASTEDSTWLSALLGKYINDGHSKILALVTFFYSIP